MSGVGFPVITHWSVAGLPSPTDKSDSGSWMTGGENDPALTIFTYLVLCDVGPVPAQFTAATLNMISCPVGRPETSCVVSVTRVLCHLRHETRTVFFVVPLISARPRADDDFLGLIIYLHHEFVFVVIFDHVALDRRTAVERRRFPMERDGSVRDLDNIRYSRFAGHP